MQFHISCDFRPDGSLSYSLTLLLRNSQCHNWYLVFRSAIKKGLHSDSLPVPCTGCFPSPSPCVVQTSLLYHTFFCVRCFSLLSVLSTEPTKVLPVIYFCRGTLMQAVRYVLLQIRKFISEKTLPIFGCS